MDHLCTDFKQKGIHAFRDDSDLPKGEEISPQLYKAIEESRFLIVIFSKNYASSSWCLRELVKILECKKMENPKYEVRIIFYDVKPDVVRKQTESYAEAFVKHQVFNRIEVDKWKEALSIAANLSGWDLQDMTNGYESKFIDSISKEILKQLCDGPLHVGENLVGIDIHLDKLDLLRFVGSDKVNMIEICGISGIGKTTLAKAIYNLMYIHFEGSCFCEDVQGVTKRQGLTAVQMDMIHKILKTEDMKISSIGEGTMVISHRIGCRPILLVLDDVNDLQQLEALAGSRDWFSPGSLIIFTCKDKQLLKPHKVDMVHEMRTLDDYEALELFCLYAFGIKHATEDFKKLASQIVNCMQGHPLALKVFGRLLYEKSVSVWKSELCRLQAYPNSEIQQKLLPSYEGLEYDRKRIFLDIACSFIGENRDFAESVLLDSNDCSPEAGIEVLVDRFLVTLSAHDMSLQMHELIQSMAREIVRKESSMPGNRSRLWVNPSEIYTVLSENNATQVEIIDLLHKRSSQEFDIDVKAFAHMKNLRILKLPMDSVVNYSGKLEYLSNKLRLLYWHGCPFKQLPSDFYPHSIVAIDLSYSHIQNLWTTPKCFGRLKVMKLSYCCNLRSTPDCTEITNLEELYLDGCVNLVVVHPSIGMLKRLVVLNMKNCSSLNSFSSKLQTDSLQILNLSGCLKVDKLPENLWCIKTLLELHIDRTAITELSSFGRYERIRPRWWTSVTRLFGLPSKQQPPKSLVLSSFTGLPLLRSLNLSYCNISQVPDSIGGLSCLEELYLKGNNFTSLPESLSRLSSLRSMYLDDCKKLEVLPDLPHSLYYIYTPDCTSLREVLVSSNHQPMNRKSDFSNCPRLFKNLVTIDSQVSVNQTQCLDSSIDSQGSTNQQLSTLLWYTGMATNMGEFFGEEAESFIALNIIYHADSIPKWFRNQSMGNQVKVELPSDRCYTKCRGYATCVVFKPKKTSCMYAGYSVKTFDGILMFDNPGFCIPDFKKERWIGINESYMIWLHYTNRHTGKWKEAKNYVTFTFKDLYDFFEVKECGVRVVCEEDLQQTTDLLSTLPTPTKYGGWLRQYNYHNGVDTQWSW